jgi:hypothetical protein
VTEHQNDPREPDDPRSFLADLASWLEQRLDETVGWVDGSRLYGITVHDPSEVSAGRDGSARFTFLAEGFVYDLLSGPAADLAIRHDALALCCFGMSTNLESGDRMRSRTVLVATADGQVAINRVEGGSPIVAVDPVGGVPDAVQLLFAGEYVPPMRRGSRARRVRQGCRSA